MLRCASWRGDTSHLFPLPWPRKLALAIVSQIFRSCCDKARGNIPRQHGDIGRVGDQEPSWLDFGGLYCGLETEGYCSRKGRLYEYGMAEEKFGKRSYEGKRIFYMYTSTQ